MKVAILSESAADEAGIRTLIGAMIGREVHVAPVLPLRTRGWPAVLGVIKPVMRHLYYGTDAEAFVLVVDSNSSPVFADPPPTGADLGRCRIRQVRRIVGDALTGCAPVAGRPSLKVAVGVAVPAIEAWYLCGTASDVSESAWLGALGRPSLPYSKASLKQRAYGTDRPSLLMETEKAREHAIRLAKNLLLVEQRFPIGFGSLARDVRAWTAG